MRDDQVNRITERIIGAAIEVHRALGPGLLESTHKACLAYDLSRICMGFSLCSLGGNSHPKDGVALWLDAFAFRMRFDSPPYALRQFC
jgi:PD-(D/E)XK nuclease superfamily